MTKKSARLSVVLFWSKSNFKCQKLTETPLCSSLRAFLIFNSFEKIALILVSQMVLVTLVFNEKSTAKTIVEQFFDIKELSCLP